MTIDSPQVAALKLRYQKSFAEKSAVLAEFQNMFVGPEHKACDSAVNQNSETVGDYLHKLAGSAGMYGYDGIAQVARAGMANATQDDLAGLLQNLSQLRELLDQPA